MHTFSRSMFSLFFCFAFNTIAMDEDTNKENSAPPSARKAKDISATSQKQNVYFPPVKREPKNWEGYKSKKQASPSRMLINIALRKNFHDAIEAGNLRQVKSILAKEGSAFLEQTPELPFPLKAAYKNYNKSPDESRLLILVHLLESGANPNVFKIGPSSLLYQAISDGNIELASHLFSYEKKASCYPDELDDAIISAFTSYQVAVKDSPIEVREETIRQALSVVEWLLKLGANPHVRFRNNDTMLHLAVRNNDLASAALLLKYGSDLRSINKANQTPLDLLNSERQGEMTQLILQLHN